MITFLAYLILSIALAVAGQSKKIGGIATFFISFLLTPLTGLIVVLLSKKKTIIQEKPHYTCNSCGFTFEEEFEYCYVCGKNSIGEKKTKENVVELEILHSKN